MMICKDQPTGDKSLSDRLPHPRTRGRRRDRNRKRTRKRRSIFCPLHGCYLDSTSGKYSLFASKASHLRERGMGRKPAYLLIATYGTIPLKGEWLERFWCKACDDMKWYHVRLKDKTYTLSLAPPELWKQATGVLNPEGNPTVSEFTRKASRMAGVHGMKTYGFMERKGVS
ncbi:MAG: hypothetical protein ACO4AI_06435 [Prochlorothrix sp.]